MVGIDRSLVVWYKNCSCWGTFHWLQVFWVKPFVTVPFLVIFRNMLYCMVGSTYRALPVREEQGMKQAFGASYSGCQGVQFVLNCLKKNWKNPSQHSVNICLFHFAICLGSLAKPKLQKGCIWAVVYHVSEKERAKWCGSWIVRSLKGLFWSGE